jgi:hypothetical protein
MGHEHAYHVHSSPRNTKKRKYAFLSSTMSYGTFHFIPLPYLMAWIISTAELPWEPQLYFQSEMATYFDQKPW